MHRTAAGGACPNVTDLRTGRYTSRLITATERHRFIRLLTETGECGGRRTPSSSLLTELRHWGLLLLVSLRRPGTLKIRRLLYGVDWSAQRGSPGGDLFCADNQSVSRYT